MDLWPTLFCVKKENRMGVKETVRGAIEPKVVELGYRIWDVTYSKIGADYHLEITIDSDNGINIEDCEKVHRAIDPILDECDPIENFYYLEVSSPGIEREIRTEEHIMLSLGETVDVKLFAAKDGRKAFVAKLLSYENGVIAFDIDGERVELSKNEISKMTTVFFDGDN